MKENKSSFPFYMILILIFTYLFFLFILFFLNNFKMTDIFLGDGSNLNSGNSFGTSVGSKFISGIINANPLINSSITTQPVESKYNNFNPPLV